MRKALTILICVFTAVCITVSAAGNADLNNIINKKNELQQNINAAKDKKNAANAEYQVIEDQMLALQTEIDKINSKLNELNEKEKTLTEELNLAIEKEEKQEETLKTRLRVMYEDGATSYFKILLSSESIFDFFYNLERLSQITEYDNKILKELAESKKIIEEKKVEIEEVIAAVETEKAAEMSKKAELQYQSDLKVAYMKRLESDIAEYTKNYQKAEAEEARVRAELAAAARNISGSVPSKYTGGVFQWPAPASTIITSPYGYRIHPIFKTSKLHRGIDIGVGSGNNVVAAADGVVIRSTYNSSYGYYVSINHGGGLVTLYAHNSSLCVSEGQTVKRGQLVAISGNTGNSTGPHLHFEVMVNGQTTDPMAYF